MFLGSVVVVFDSNDVVFIEVSECDFEDAQGVVLGFDAVHGLFWDEEFASRCCDVCGFTDVDGACAAYHVPELVAVFMVLEAECALGVDVEDLDGCLFIVCELIEGSSGALLVVSRCGEDLFHDVASPMMNMRSFAWLLRYLMNCCVCLLLLTIMRVLWCGGMMW